VVFSGFSFFSSFFSFDFFIPVFFSSISIFFRLTFSNMNNFKIWIILKYKQISNLFLIFLTFFQTKQILSSNISNLKNFLVWTVFKFEHFLIWTISSLNTFQTWTF
jgi:hypothetical protein